MSVKTKKEKKIKKPVDKETKTSRMILLIGLLIIIIPCLVLGVILINATRGQNVPAVGERFSGDLDPAITSSNISSIENSIKSISGVEGIEVNLKTATLKVDVDVKDSSSKQEIESIAQKAYDVVTKELSVETYFTNTTSKRMYDLNILVFNKIDNEDGSMIQYEIVKNATSRTTTKRYIVGDEPKASE